MRRRVRPPPGGGHDVREAAGSKLALVGDGALLPEAEKSTREAHSRFLVLASGRAEHPMVMELRNCVTREKAIECLHFVHAPPFKSIPV